MWYVVGHRVLESLATYQNAVQLNENLNWKKNSIYWKKKFRKYFESFKLNVKEKIDLIMLLKFIFEVW